MNALVPRDIPLPLPAPEWLLQFILLVSFAAHILFVNLMVGGQLMTLIFQWIGLKDKKWDEVAHTVAKTVTVNKSIAVVLGVGPLLSLNVLYTTYIYSANALTGTAWLLLIPLISAAFILTYLHKYTWEALEDHKGVHISIAAMATLLFLFIPLIFLTNMNLMLFPERWPEVKGFLSALFLPNVFSRYFHFIAASLTATSLFLIGFLGKKKESNDIFQQNPGFLFQVRQKLYGVCFGVTIAQFVIGPLVLFTLPSHGISILMLVFLGIAVFFAAFLLHLLYKEMKKAAPALGKNYSLILVVFTVIVGLMVNVRHFYREQALASHKKIQKEQTEAFIAESAAAIIDKSIAKDIPAGDIGKVAFESTCGGCHAIDKVLVGPSVIEIQKIYAGNRDGIVTWSKNPGKKRQGMSMPSMAHVPETELGAIADWMLNAK